LKRKTTTFRKLPTITPKMNAKIRNRGSTKMNYLGPMQ
jgi:hypothetical protein